MGIKVSSHRSWSERRLPQNIMAMPKPKQPIHATGYYRPRRIRPVRFLPPMKVKLNEPAIASPRRKKNEYKSATITNEKDRRGRYKDMIMTIACNLTMENVSDMKFLCKDHVHPPELLDKVRYPRDLITLLENQRLLAENSLYFIQTSLYYISRLDLYELVLEFRVDNQQEYKERGVDIKAVYDLRNDSSERVALAQELSQFRRDLKPRSRLQRADVHGLRNRLHDLTTKMHDHVSEMRQTSDAKFKLLHAGVQLPPITNADKMESDSEENDDVVVKLKLYNRHELNEISKPEPNVRRKRTRMPSERLSMSSNISVSTNPPSEEGIKPPSGSAPLRIVVPRISYEQDERLRLTPHVTKTKRGTKKEEDVFRYTTPIPPPRLETMSKVGKVTNGISLDKSSKEGTEKEVKILEQLADHNSLSSGKSTASVANCGHESTGAGLDTEHLSKAIQKLRKKMGTHISVDHSRGDNFQSTASHKTKRRKNMKKDGHDFSHSKALISKSKKRKMSDKTAAKLPDIYDKFARRKSTSQVQYMNLLK